MSGSIGKYIINVCIYVARCTGHGSVRGAVSGVEEMGSEWANVSAELFSPASRRLAMYVRMYIWIMYCELVLWVNSDFRGCIISTYVCMHVWGAAVLMEKKNASMRMAMYVRIKLVLWVNSDFRECNISAYVHMYVSMHE